MTILFYYGQESSPRSDFRLKRHEDVPIDEMATICSTGIEPVKEKKNDQITNIRGGSELSREKPNHA